MASRQWLSTVLYWGAALLVVSVGGFALAYAGFLFGARALDATSLNTWGDPEGLVLPFWIGYVVLVVAGLAGAALLRRRGRSSRAAAAELDV